MDEEAVREELLNRGLADPVTVLESQLPHKNSQLNILIIIVGNKLTI